MRLKLAPRFMLFAGLCVCLMSEELWLRNAPASNTGRIVFTSRRDGNNEIYVMDADGGNQENLTNHPAYDGQPDWPPEGTKIAFSSAGNDGKRQIHVINADGSHLKKLTNTRDNLRSQLVSRWATDCIHRPSRLDNRLGTSYRRDGCRWQKSREA